jgi:hypothetical protein
MKKRAAHIVVLVCIGLGCVAGIALSQPPQVGGDAAEAHQLTRTATTIDVSKIYGKIQIVKSFPDYKVQVVDSFPDLRVQIVNSFPDKSGKWQIVNSFPDFKIQIVDSFPDFKIKYVSSFPGKE